MRPLIVILAIAIAIAAAITFTHRANRPAFEVLEPQDQTAGELPKLWQLPDFSLTERSGRTITLANLKGSVWVADFFYTSCPGPCPMLSSRLSELNRETPVESPVRFVSISSDPEKDTPEVLKKYAEHFGATDRWLFLTGDKQAIYTLANQGFKLALAEDRSNTAEPIAHSTKLVLVDRDGFVRGVYDGVGPEGKQRILRDLRRLLIEKS